MDLSKQEFKSFLELEMQYPEDALKSKEQGKVKLEFIVDSSGHIKQIEVIQSVSEKVDKEAIRLLKHIQYKPAFIGGRFINSSCIVTIPFKVKKYLKACKVRGYEQININSPVDSGFKVYKAGKVEHIPEPVFNKESINLSKFISEQMEYPETAFNQNISGTVKLEFIVEKSGNATHIKIMDAVGGGCDQEAIRILKLLKWKPGIKNKKAVRTKMTLDFTFGLNEKKGHNYLPNNQNNSM